MAAPDDDRRRAAAFEHIRQWGDPVLRTAALPIDAFDEALRERAAAMVLLMDDASGAGLAAPQVGVPSRLLVYRLPDEADARVLVNPSIESASEETVRGVEGCLSLGEAGVWVEVDRARSVVVTASDLDGGPVHLEAEDRHARILQHEIDHLDGVLILDRTDRDQRREAVRALREGRSWHPPEPAPGGDAA